ncbi:MAG TPA: FAD-dependent monooxygenase [Trebonia sp.]|jgi:2-polyprenyl-6-methoxyphenol hydroxylase-like FAD-dependent oxidoreductase
MTTAPSRDLETPVLIVGGGPVGLALALDLAVRGIRSTLVERDEGTAAELLAKAGTLNERTMEYCRRLGISDAIANVGFPDDHPRDTVYCTALNGFVLGRDYRPSTNDRAPSPESPEILRKCPQFRFDPLLAKAVQERGLTQILYGTSWLAASQDDSGVTSALAAGREPVTVRSKYLVGCDGAGSAVRRAAGIDFTGRQLDYSVSAMIEVEHLERYHPLGRAERYMFIGTEGTWANLTAVDGRSLWRLTLVGSEERLAPEHLDFDAIMRRAMGNDRGEWTVRRVMPWRRSQFTADTYTAGRVLLAGDAAHTTSPTGGHGLNTGLGDVSDLGWMLDALIRGWGGERLLAAYSAERRPVAIRNGTSSTKNYGAWVRAVGRDLVLDDTPEGEAQRRAVGEQMNAMLAQEWHSFGVAMGYRYDTSPVVVPDGTPPTPDDPSEYVPTARPGHRAPHAWLADGRSTIDLFGDGFTLLRLGGGADAGPLEAAAADRGVPLRVVAVDDPAVARLYERRLVLVRPDGMVAWRADSLPDDASLLVATVTGNAGGQLGGGRAT